MSQSPHRFKVLMRQARLTRRSLLGQMVAAGMAAPVMSPVVGACIAQEESRASGVNNQPGKVFDPAFAYENLGIDHLDRILPVIRSGRITDATVTLASLEIYQDGFNAVLVFEWEDREANPFQSGGVPVVSIRDDQGHQYQGTYRAGHGGGLPGMICNFAPALDPATKELTFEFQWVETPFNVSRETGMVFSEDDIVAGPRSVTIPIDQQGGANGESDTELDLLRVIPVTQYQEASDFSVSLMSMEVYRDRFIALGRMDWTAEAAPYQPTPEPEWSIRDDQGNTYDVNGSSVSGGGVPPVQEGGIWPRSSRISGLFEPEIEPGARTITLEISAIRMVRYIPDSEQPKGEVTDIVTGPWRFEVQL